MNVKKVAGIAAGVMVGITLLACGGSAKPSGDKAVSSSRSATSPATSPAAEPTTSPSLAYNEPTVKDFTLKVRVTEKKSFDTAGCNVKYRVYDLTYNGLLEGLNPDKEYELTYEVRGIEGGASDTITFQGGKYSSPDEEYGSISQKTCRKAKPLTVVVTEVNAL